ncbi:Aste57867_13408 [Aphanomyces stellatus]|uniref:phosphatidylinositol-3,5-bisphosphate 3-phosphatase n=1 Tax=Aphanomyces stellatus TaxID=120398 RepID=A0A485KZR5_9STRA|nr:hypothetical protein As57867_013358 [Aphanomyces stellatus]VFT90247.1 Aste57867_13408 [Aphanomyces stellatus]
MAHLSQSLQIAPPPPPSTHRRPDAASPMREETFRQMLMLHEAHKSVVSWVPDALADRCYHCQAVFSLVLRRHHCRRCGNVFCDACSSSRMPLVSAGFFTPVRVCDKCCDAAKKTHRRLYNERKRLSQSMQLEPPPHNSNSNVVGHPSSTDNLHLLLHAAAAAPLSPMDESESSYTASPHVHQFTTMIDVIHGEIVTFRSPNVRLRIPNGCEYAGTVYVSNYRVVFTQTSPDCISSSDACQRSHRRHPTVLAVDQFTAAPRYHAIPLRTIERVKRQELAESDTGILHLVCKDVRRVHLVFLGLVKQQTFSQFDRCDRELKGRGGPFFAKVHQESFAHATFVDGWALYDPVAEFNRLGVGATTKWRITDINVGYDFCQTYSSSIGVPATVSDDVLRVARAFRSKHRIPALTWRDKKTGATLTRSSQPLVGLGQKQCPEDVMLIQAIAATNPSSSTMIIVDARPWRNAMAQKTVGMAGYELTAHYEVKVDGEGSQSPLEPMDDDDQEEKTMMLGPTTCRLVFMGIENIHVMRKSFQKLAEICLASDPQHDAPGKWHEQLASSKWMDHLSRILHASVEIVRLIKTDKASVLVHCSDGWDRTSQLTGLAELMLDPYYRTIRGFCLLVEKDWCSFGYKFCERTGHAADPNSQEISVVFVQWIDCVWQIWRQFPCSFEFNTRFLILILDHLYSCRFGTFLYDSEHHRVLEEGQHPTTSLWTYLSSLERSFISNPFYEPRKYSRQNWHARIVERRQATEYPMTQWHHPRHESHATTGGTADTYVHGLVGLEEKEDGVVLVHTDSSQHLAAVAATAASAAIAASPTAAATAAAALDLPPGGKKPKKKVHSIVQDLDTGLMFPHVIETTVVSSPMPSPRAFSLPCAADSSPPMLFDDNDSVDMGTTPMPTRHVFLGRRPNGDDDGDDDGDDGASSSSESEGSQASSKDVRSFGPDADVLLPSVSVKCLRLWSEYYLRWDASVTIERNGDLEREAKLRDVLGELEYCKRQKAHRSGTKENSMLGPARSVSFDANTTVDDDDDDVGLAMEDLFEEAVTSVLEGRPPVVAPRATLPTGLSTSQLRQHDHAVERRLDAARHRLAMDRMQMQYEDFLSNKL